MTDDTDPILAAVEQSLREQATAWWQTPPRLDLAADVAVEAHRRAVLDRRDDGPVARIQRQYEQRRRLIAQGVYFGNASIATTDEDVGALLAALADAQIARRQAADAITRVREKAVALLDGELAHRSRDYGRGVAHATRDILAALDG